MRTSKVVICLLFATLSLAEINENFKRELHGQAPLTDEKIDAIYSQFLNEYKDANGFTPSNRFVLRNENRKAVFTQKVKEIAEFNSKNLSYKKGINQFSDMTEDEFFDYYHLVNDNQECSATHKAAL
jgi:hypothetical protein